MVNGHMAEGQGLGIRLTEGGVVAAERLRACVGFVQHASAEVNSTDPAGLLCERACKESCPACHISDAPPPGETSHSHNQLQQPLIGHGTALSIMGHLPVKLGAHLRLHRGR